jgi:hypothetical protein
MDLVADWNVSPGRSIRSSKRFLGGAREGTAFIPRSERSCREFDSMDRDDTFAQ